LPGTSRAARLVRQGLRRGEGLDSLRTDAAGNVSVPGLQAGQGSGTAYSGGKTTPGYPGAFGVMRMTLGAHGYAWHYQSAQAPSTASGSPAWGTFGDSGSGYCHGPAA